MIHRHDKGERRASPEPVAVGGDVAPVGFHPGPNGWAARTHPPGTSIAAVFPDGPQRYFDTIYNDDYCREHDLLDRGKPHGPDLIAHPTDQVVRSWTRTRMVVDPSKVAR